jgi:hypothetical protein
MAPPCTLRSARSGEVSGIRVLGILKNEKFGAYPNRQNSDQGSASFPVFFFCELGYSNLGNVWDSSINSTVEQLHKKLEFMEHLGALTTPPFFLEQSA